jgi:hypothetical protein
MNAVRADGEGEAVNFGGSQIGSQKKAKKLFTIAKNYCIVINANKYSCEIKYKSERPPEGRGEAETERRGEL